MLDAWMRQGRRRDRGQTAVARALGVSQPAVRQWLLGLTRPELSHRLALQELTGIAAEAWERPEEKQALEETLARIRVARDRKHSPSSQDQLPPSSRVPKIKKLGRRKARRPAAKRAA